MQPGSYMMHKALFSPSRVVVQGITGAQGSFHTKAMLDYGTPIIAGTSPHKAGQSVHGVPVYANLKDIPGTIDATVIFVPAPHAKAAILEAISQNIPLIVVVTEGIPVHDMLYIKQRLVHSTSRVIGPNSPGILLPGNLKLGIIPSSMAQAGSVGIVSRSGTLTYEAMAELSERGIGQAYVIGIGGDPIKGTGFVDALRLFEEDPAVSSIVMMGEIGGTEEVEAAQFIKTITKPVFAYIAGHHAPAGVQLGHAGAILGSDEESAPQKTLILEEAGATTASSISSLITRIKS